jgi:hypothetical protein
LAGKFCHEKSFHPYSSVRDLIIATSSGITSYCTTGYCQRRPLILSFATSLKYRAHIRRVFKRDLFRKNTHFYEIEAEHLFHIYLPKDDNLLHGVGIFRVQPSVVEVGLVENTRELGKLQ